LVKLRIANFVIHFYGRSEYLHERFKDFLYEGNGKPDMTIRVIERKPFFVRYLYDKGTSIGDFSFYHDKNVMQQYYKTQNRLEVRLVKGKDNYKETDIYLCDRYKGYTAKLFGQKRYLEMVQGLIFNALQQIFYNRILFEDAMSIHSASVIYNNKAVVFSASSGTGKSTQANLWQQELGCQMLDGDVTVCREREGRLYVYGLPWCGSSGKYINKEVELGAIIFLKQAKDNTVRVPNLREKISYVFSSTFSESLTEEMARRVAGVTQKIVENAPIYEYSCNMQPEAVSTLKDAINKDLS
jgi:hypothetical protein